MSNDCWLDVYVLRFRFLFHRFCQWMECCKFTSEVCFSFNTLRPRRNEQHFADDIFKRIFFNENVWISLKISLKFVPKGPIINIPALVQIMAWRRSGDKPLSEPMMASLPTHICVTRPQWVKWNVWLKRCQTYDQVRGIRSYLATFSFRSRRLGCKSVLRVISHRKRLKLTHSERIITHNGYADRFASFNLVLIRL